MKIIISPAKTLNEAISDKPEYASLGPNFVFDSPHFLSESKKLVAVLKEKTTEELAQLMKISDKLAELNQERYQKWPSRFTLKNSKPAIFAFKGDVYEGINIASYSKRELERLQNSLLILSGLYGALRPLDLMRPYRLEMGTKLANPQGENLYKFWQDKIAEYINGQCQKNEFIINLASEEYFKSVKKYLSKKVFTPIFLDEVKGKFKVVSFWAKKARGLMVSYLIKNKVKSIEEIKNFKEENYFFHSYDEEKLTMVFHRRH